MTLYIGEEIISTSTMCSVAINPIKTYQEELEKDTTKALFKEMWGYSLYNPNSGLPSSMKSLTDYTCKDGSFSLKFGFDTYTGPDSSEAIRGKKEQVAAMEMNKYYQQSKKILAENRMFLDKLTAALLEKKMLTRKEIQEIRGSQFAE